MPVLGNCPCQVIKSLGLVFGDIGTSPIYTVGAILLFLVILEEKLIVVSVIGELIEIDLFLL